MANGMALILTKPVEELIPALIGWNNTELLAQVKERLEEYKGKIYDESSIAEAKADRATLNKFADTLNEERKRIGKVYSAPLDRFTKEVNEVISVVDAASKEIDVQVKAYDERRKAERLEEIKAFFTELLPENLAEFIPYEKIHQKEWLNASKTMTAVKKEVDAAITKIVQELNTIELLKSDDEAGLKAIYFNSLNFAEAISAHECRKAEKARVEAAMAAAKQTPVEEKKEAPAPVSASVAKEYSITFKVTGTKAELMALSAFLQENEYKYEKL